jgi:lysyl endopeptidase
VQAEDEERAALGLAPRFAIPNEVLISPATDGVWKDLDERTRQWRLRITSPGALSLNLGFTAYFMPPGGQLWLYATDGSYALEPYTDFHNADHGELWTAVVLADDILVEVTLPAAVEKELILHLTSINVGYRGFGETQADKAGACNIDVICPVADAWRNEIPAIGVISTGGFAVLHGVHGEQHGAGSDAVLHDGVSLRGDEQQCGVAGGVLEFFTVRRAGSMGAGR